MAEQLAYDIVKGKDTLSPALKNTEKASSRLTSNLKDSTQESTLLGRSLKTAARAMAGYLALKFSIQGIRGSIEDAVELENALIGLRSVARNTGNDVGFITEQAKELARDGLVPLADVSRSLKNLLGTGFDGEQAVAVFKKLRDSASFNRQGLLDLGEAIAGASEGLKNDLSIKVDNAGITKNLSNIQKEYAASIGKTIGGLTASERVQGKYVGIMKEGAVFTGDFNRLLGTFSGVSSAATTQTQFLSAEFGNLIIKSPDVITGIKDIATSINGLTGIIKENAPALSKIVGSIGALLLMPIDGLIKLTSAAALDVGILATAVNNAGSASLVTRNELSQLTESVKSLKVALGQAEEKGLNEGIIQSIKDRMKAEAELIRTKLGGLQQLRDEVAKAAVAENAGGPSGGNPGDDPEVLRQRAVDQILNDLRIERAEKEAELSEIKKEADTLKTEEKLISLQSQLDLENDIRKIAAEQEAALKIKTDKDIEKIEASGRKRRLDDTIKSLKAELAMEKLAQTQKNNIIGNSFAFGAAIAKDGSKAQFLIQKAGALAQIAVADGQARASAMAAAAVAGIATGGTTTAFTYAYLSSLITANTALSAGTVVASTIKGFERGGPLSSGTRVGDNVVFSGNKDEGVFTRAQQAELFSIANGRGAEQQQQSQQPQGDVVIHINGREIARAVRDQINEGFKIA